MPLPQPHLQLPDGTALTLGENSHINLYSLAFDAQSSVRISRMQVLRGALHMVLSEGYQIPGSSFTVQTSNVEVVLQNEQGADAEVQYVPNTSVTTILANKSDLLITHLLTEISMPHPVRAQRHNLQSCDSGSRTHFAFASDGSSRSRC